MLLHMLISQSSATANYNAWDEDIAMVKVNLNWRWANKSVFEYYLNNIRIVFEKLKPNSDIQIRIRQISQNRVLFVVRRLFKAKYICIVIFSKPEYYLYLYSAKFLKINGCTFSKLSCELYVKPTPISDFLWKGINVWVQKVSSNGATVKNVNFWFIIIRYASLTWVGYFSQMGGLFGLCLGFRLIQHSVQYCNSIDASAFFRGLNLSTGLSLSCPERFLLWGETHRLPQNHNLLFKEVQMRRSTMMIETPPLRLPGGSRSKTLVQILITKHDQNENQ